MTFFLTGILLSSSLQTGLVSTSDYLTLNSYEDIIENDYNPITASVSMCGSHNQNELLTGKAGKTTDIIQYRSAANFYNLNSKDKYVSIINEIIYEAIKHIGCSTNQEDEKRNPLGKSDSPISRTIQIYLIDRYNSLEVNQIITRRIYSSFEHQLIRNEDLIKVENKYQGINVGLQSCMNFKVEKHQSTARISFNYLFISFTILIIGYLIGFTILVVKSSIIN